MPHDHTHASPRAQPFCQLLRQTNRAMLSAGAAERNHQTLKSTPLIFAHAGIYQRHHAGQELMHAFLLIQIVDHRCISTRERLEALLSSWIWQAAAIENESAAMASFAFRQSAMKGEAHNPHRSVARAGSQALQ